LWIRLTQLTPHSGFHRFGGLVKPEHWSHRF
jgi:hypothetical protein